MKKSTHQKFAILNIWLRVHFSKIIAILFFLSASNVNAQLYWNTNGTSSTLTATNWGTSPSGPFTTAWSNSSNINFTANSAITNVTNIPVGNLSITNSSTVTWTAAGTFSTNGAIRTFDIGTGSTLIWNGQGVSTTAGTGFIKNGTGVWNIGAQGNAFPGGFTLNAGTVVIGGVNAMGTGVLSINGGVIVPNSGTSRTPANSSFVIGGDFQIGDATNFPANTGAIIFSATAAMSLGASTRTITIGGTNTGSLLGIISGDTGAGLTFNSISTGFINLSGINTYSGPTTINSGAIIRLPATTASASPLGTTTNGTTVNSGGNLELNSNRSTNQEPITINGDGISGGGAISNNVANSYAEINGLVTLGSSSSIIAGSGTSQSIILRNAGTITGSGYNLTIGGGNAASTNTSQIYSIIGTGSGALTKTGPGTWYLYGANTYTGLTTVTNGTLILSKTGGGTLLATNNVAVSGGTLKVSSNQTISNLDMSGSGSLIVDPGVTLTITGTYTGGGSGTINNQGTIVLNGTSLQTFPGSSMTINNGTANTMTNLTINNSNGVNINKSFIISGTLNATPISKLTLLDSGISLTAGNFIIQSNATGSATFIDNGGILTLTTATAQQQLAAARNWYMSSPVSGATGLPTVNSGSVVFYSYPENDAAQATGGSGFAAGGVWNTVDAGSFVTGKGYIVKPGDVNATVSFTGTSFNTGDKIISALTNTTDNPKHGFNLIGNPYPSYVNVLPSVTANANLEPTVWYRTRDTNETPLYHFETVNATSGVGTNAAGTGRVTGFIPPMQGFWVRTNADGESITLLNANRSHATSVSMTDIGVVPTTGLKAPAAVKSDFSLLGLYVTNGSTGDETILMFAPGASNDQDVYDSQKISNNNASIPEIYTLAGKVQLAINGMRNFSETEIPLGFTTGTAGNFTIKTSELRNFDSNTRIWLLDKQENKQTELTPETEYTFSSAATTGNESRFSLLFRAPGATTGNVNAESNQVSVFVNAQNEIVINAVEGSRYSVYNTAGQQMAAGKTGSSFETINQQLNNGVYVVRVGSVSKRVIVK